MDPKIEINRLAKDELIYEIKIRGIDEVSSIDSMRKSLRYLIKLAKNPSFVQPKYPFTFKDDCEAIENKIKEIKDLLASFADVKASKEYKKLETKIAHSIGRVNRCVASNDKDNGTKTKLLGQLITLQSDLKSRAKSVKHSSTVVSQLLEHSLASVSVSTSGSDVSDTDSELEEVNLRVELKSVPVSKWDLKFSGDTRHVSVNAFLERVNELRVARNVSKQQLHCTAIDLFTGNALIWYRANRSTFSTWDEVVEGLRQEFQPIDYDDKLYEEIRHRTQGPRESIGMYIAVMTSLFSRLRSKLSEEARVRILLRNITPFYQTQLGLMDIKSVAELLKLCRRLEERKESVEAYVPPPQRGNAIEPDLAYVYTEPSSFSSGHHHHSNTPSSSRYVQSHNKPSVVDTVQGDSRSCWNCGRTGHLAFKCREPRKRHCYRCGKADVTVNTCPSCRPGNGK